MVTKNLVYRNSKAEREPVCQYRIEREADTLTVVLFGLGVVIFFIGLCTGLLGIGQGLVGCAASWALAFAIRAYFGEWEYDDTIDEE
mgnify:FL=1